MIFISQMINFTLYVNSSMQLRHFRCLQGDSGGSLSCYDDGEWYFAGISSFGPQSCVMAPSAYTAVSTQVKPAH